MLNLSLLQKNCDLLSRICACALLLVIPLSVAANSTLLPLAIALSLVAGHLKNKYAFVKNNPVVWITLLLFMVYACSSLYSIGSLSQRWLDLHRYLKLAFVALLIPMFDQERWRKLAINILIITLTFTLLLSYLKYFHLIHFRNALDANDLFHNHIITSFYLAFLAYITLLRATQKQHRFFYSLLFLLTTYNIFFINVSRTGYLVYLVLMTLFFWQKFNWKGLLLGLITLSVLLSSALLFSSLFKNNLHMVAQNIHDFHQNKLYENSIGLRMDFAEHSWQLIKEHPVIGTGVGSFLKRYQRFGDIPSIGPTLRTPHNEFLMTTVQLGVVGLMCLLAIFYVQWRCSFYLPGDYKLLSQALVVGFMTGCCCDALLYAAATGYFYIYLTALLFAPLQKKSLDQEFVFSQQPKFMLS